MIRRNLPGGCRCPRLLAYGIRPRLSWAFGVHGRTESSMLGMDSDGRSFSSSIAERQERFVDSLPKVIISSSPSG